MQIFSFEVRSKDKKPHVYCLDRNQMNTLSYIISARRQDLIDHCIFVLATFVEVSMYFCSFMKTIELIRK